MTEEKVRWKTVDALTDFINKNGIELFLQSLFYKLKLRKFNHLLNYFDKSSYCQFFYIIDVFISHRQVILLFRESLIVANKVREALFLTELEKIVPINLTQI